MAPGVSLSSADVDRRFFAWRSRHASDDALAVYRAGYRAGGRDALLQSAELAELVPHLRALIAWFEEEHP